MGKVGKEEIAQWMDEMLSLAQEYNVISKRIVKVWEKEKGRKGFSDYREVCGEWELPAILEKLNKMPLPKDEVCEALKKDCEQTLCTLIETRAIDAKHVWKSDRPWFSQMHAALATTPGPFSFMLECCEILVEKYQMRRERSKLKQAKG